MIETTVVFNTVCTLDSLGELWENTDVSHGTLR